MSKAADLWLRKPAAAEPSQKSAVPNVSMADVARVARAKAEREQPAPDIKSSHDINSSEPLQNAGDDLIASPDIKSSHDIMSIRPEQWTAYPNDISDRILRTLELSDQAILLRLYRLSHGFHKDTCKVTTGTLAEACNVTPRQVPRSTQRLVARKLIEVVEHDFSNPNRRERGTVYRVLLPPATPDIKSRADIKSRDAIRSSPDINSTTKHTHLKETHTNTESRLAPSVRAGSRFALAECRRYAESLRKDGITNPGGYATRIHRSGEADDLIATFLAPAPASATIDIARCPDCHGTGFYEPGGAGKGVAKCKHERLTAE